jgi:hypothetical protein
MNIVFLYQKLLRLCPEDFYQKYAREMTLLFQESLRDVRQSKAAYPISFLLMAFLDVLKTIFEQQFLKGKEMNITENRIMRFNQAFCIICGVFMILLAASLWKNNLLIFNGINEVIVHNPLNVFIIGFLTLFNSLSMFSFSYFAYKLGVSKIWISIVLMTIGSGMSLWGQSQFDGISDIALTFGSSWWYVWFGLFLSFASWCSLALSLRASKQAQKWFLSVLLIGLLSVLGWGLLQIGNSNRVDLKIFGSSSCVGEVSEPSNGTLFKSDTFLKLTKNQLKQLNQCLMNLEIYSFNQINPFIQQSQAIAIGLLCLIFAGFAWIQLGFQSFIPVKKDSHSNLDETSAGAIPA